MLGLDLKRKEKPFKKLTLFGKRSGSAATCANASKPQLENPAERVMSNLKLRLQGVGVVHAKMPTEDKVKSANNMKAIDLFANTIAQAQTAE